MTSRALLGGVLFVLAVATLALAPPGGLERLALAEPFLAPSLAHPLGTDDLGRDLLAAIAQGARTSIVVGLTVTALALGVGTAIGLAAGLAPPWLDDLSMRFTDIVASLPTLMLAILVAGLFGGSVGSLVLVMGLTRWPLVARMVRAEAASLRTREFVLAARALGVATPLIALRHVAPHASSAALAATGILFGGALVSEAALAFVGLGDPTVTSLGQLAAAGFAFVAHAPWIWIGPVAAIVGLTVLVAMISDATT